MRVRVLAELDAQVLRMRRPAAAPRGGRRRRVLPDLLQFMPGRTAPGAAVAVAVISVMPECVASSWLEPLVVATPSHTTYAGTTCWILTPAYVHSVARTQTTVRNGKW